MDFELNEDQQAILQATQKLLEQYAGAARAIELNRLGEYDTQLHEQLEAAGFAGVFHDFAQGDGVAINLEAIVEWQAFHGFRSFEAIRRKTTKEHPRALLQQFHRPYCSASASAKASRAMRKLSTAAGTPQ